MSKKLTANQQALLERLKGEALLMEYIAPGLEDRPSAWAIRNPYSDEDGRTCMSLIQRRFIAYIGDGDWQITEAGRAALADKLERGELP